MSTIGQALGGIFGAVTGFLIGGIPGLFIGFQLGLGIGSFIDPPKQNEDTSQLTNQDLQFNTFSRNLPVPVIYGRNKVAGNVLWIGNTRTEIREREADGGGGKGIGGGGAPKIKEIFYHADFHIGLSEGRITDVGSVAVDDQDVSDREGLDYDVLLGEPDQAVDPLMTTAIGADALPFRNLAYLAFHGELGQFNRIPIVTSVVDGIDTIAGQVNSGATWATIFSDGAATENMNVGVRDGAGRLFLGDGFGKIWRSTDAGSSWTAVVSRIAPNGPINHMTARRGSNDLYVVGPNSIITVGAFGNTVTKPVWKSTDQGATWTQLVDLGIGHSPITQFVSAPSYIATPGSRNIYVALRNKPSVLVDTIEDYLAYSHDDGATWAVNSGPDMQPNIDDSTAAFGIAAPEGLPGRLVAGTLRGALYTTDNDGASWNTVYANPVSGTSANDWELGFAVGGRRVVAFVNKAAATQSGTNVRMLAVSRNGGDSFTLYNEPIVDHAGGFSWLSWLDERRWFVSNAASGTVLQTRNGGRTWSTVDGIVFAGGSTAVVLAHTTPRLFMGWMSGGTLQRVSEIPISGGGCNPAWVIYDLLTNKRYGLGLDEIRIDIASFDDAADYCDTLVLNPDGTTEVRFCVDIVLEQQLPVLDHLRDILATFRGFLVWSQGTVKLRVAKDETVSQAFTMDTIVADSFVWKKQGYRERPNVLRVEYLNMADEFRHDFVEAFDDWDIDTTGERRERALRLLGIKRTTQANRMVQFYLDQAIHINHAIAFRVGIAALAAEVGDVVSVSHDVPAWTAKQFRIMEVSEAENDEMQLTLMEHNAAIYHDHAVGPPQDPIGPPQDPTALPYQVIRLSPYKRPLESLVEIAYTRATSSDFFAGAQLYRQRGTGAFEPLPEPSLALAPTAFLDSQVFSFALSTVGSDTAFTDTFDRTDNDSLGANWTEQIQTIWQVYSDTLMRGSPLSGDGPAGAAVARASIRTYSGNVFTQAKMFDSEGMGINPAVGVGARWRSASSAPTFGSSFFDAFTRTDNDSLGADWNERVQTLWRVHSNNLQRGDPGSGAAPATEALLTTTGHVMSGDAYAEARMFDTEGMGITPRVGLVARWQAVGSLGQCYYFEHDTQTASQSILGVGLHRVSSGNVWTVLSYAQVTSGTYFTKPASATKFTLSLSGNIITGLLNNTPIVSAEDANITSGGEAGVARRFAFQGYADVVLADSPFGYWRLAETVGPMAANWTASAAHVGSYASASTSLGQASLLTGDTFDRSTYFNGSGYVWVASLKFPLNSPITLECWTLVKTAEALAFQTAMTVGSNVTGANPNRALALVPNQSDGLLYFDFGNTSSGGRITTSFSAYYQARAHVVLVSGGSSATAPDNYRAIYLNGSLVASLSLCNGPAVIGHGFFIGDIGKVVAGFRGLLDEVAIYTTQLTSAQISTHYKAGIGSGTVLTTQGERWDDFQWNESTGTTVMGSVGQMYYLDYTTRTISHSIVEVGLYRVTNVGCWQTLSFAYVNSGTYFTRPGSPTTFRIEQTSYTIRGLLNGVEIVSAVDSSLQGPGEGAVARRERQVGYADVVRADSPVGYWRFGETTAAQADWWQGTHVASVPSPGAVGKTGAIRDDNDRAVQISATSNNPAAPDHAALRFVTGITMEAWVTIATTGAVDDKRVILAKLVGSNPPGYLMGLVRNVPFAFHSNSGQSLSLGAAITVGTYHHLVYTWDGSYQTFYRNATAVASQANTNPMSSNNTQQLIFGGGANPWAGTLDECALYSYAISSARVAQHYWAGVGCGTLVVTQGERWDDFVTGGGRGLLTLRHIPDGWSVRLFSPNCGTADSQVESGNTVALTFESTVASGFFQLYTDGSSFAAGAPNDGRYPATGVTSFQDGDVYDWHRLQGFVTAVQTSIPIYAPKGGFANVGSARLRAEEVGYATFADSLLTGVGRGGGGSTATSHTNVISVTLLVGSGSTATGSGQFIDVSAAATQPLSNYALFPQNSRFIVIAAGSKFPRVVVDLATNASQVVSLFYEYSTGPGSWASATRSGFLPPVDTTSGFTRSGEILVEPWGDWAPTATIASGTTMGDGTSRYALRLGRASATLSTAPVEMRVLVEGETLVTVRNAGAFVYTPVLVDSGQTLTFKAVAVTPADVAAAAMDAPVRALMSGPYLP